MNSIRFFLVLGFMLLHLFCSSVNGQSFNKQKEIKKEYYKIGLGAGNFFSAPILGYPELKGQVLPGFTFGLGKRISSHWSLQATGSFQPYAGYEYLHLNLEGEIDKEKVYSGYGCSLDFTPIFNVFPKRPFKKPYLFNFNLGVGLGYLWTYQTEKFDYNDKQYEFSFIRSSAFIPIRSNVEIDLKRNSFLEIEGAFFYTWLSGYHSNTEPILNNNHFAQVNINYKRYIKLSR